MGKLKIDFEINDLEFICNYLIVVFWIFKSNNNPYFNLVEVLSEIIYEICNKYVKNVKNMIVQLKIYFEINDL